MARSVATEANNNEKMVERLDLQNRFCSLSMLNMLLYSTPVGIQHEIDYPEIPPELIISKIDVYRKLSTISISKSSGPDCVPNWVLKSNSLILALPIASILNASIQQSLVPTIWKKADVIPIQKVKNLNDISTDLRPISLTPTLAKICERFIADWLMKSIIDKRQYGSLKRSSTTHTFELHSPFT
ncbi:Hypothetical predicted protein, partial [Paramuricea clavata]